MPNISLWTRVMVEQSQTQTLAALKAITASAYAIENGVFAFVPGLGLFQYSSASAATGDNINVIQPNSGSGRWIRVTQAAPTVNSQGQLLLSNIDFGAFEATVSGDGSADYLTVYAALTAGVQRMIVKGNTVETTSFVFPDSQYDIHIYILPGVKIDCGALNNVYDASTNGALVNFAVSGSGNPLRSGFVWSPTAEATFFNFTSAQPGSRIDIDSAYIDASDATASAYHGFVGGSNISFFSTKLAIALSNATSSFIEGYNIILDNPLLLGSGTTCAAVVNCPDAEVCTIRFPVFINQFSSTAPVISAKNLTFEGGYNVAAATILISGENITMYSTKERGSGLSFDIEVDGESTVSNCYLPSGTIYLSSTSSQTIVNSSVFANLDASADPATGIINASNVTFTQPQDFGTTEDVIWNLSDVNVQADAQITGINVSWVGGSVGAPGGTETLTITVGSTNALVTGVRTVGAIVNNEPSATLGFNPYFA